jgi:hypothetical protein
MPLASSIHCPQHQVLISYILKQTWCLFVYVDKNWAVLKDSSSHCLFPLEQTWWCLSVCGDKQGRAGAGQGNCCGGPGEVPFLLKKSLGKTEGPASNQTKIIFIIEHIKKTIIFFKKKIETK